MKILVSGYYGKQNAGDDLLQQAIAELFSPHRMLFTSWRPGFDTLRSADTVVIGGGSIWPGDSLFALGDQLSKQIDRPIIVIGISSRSPCDKTLAKTRTLIQQTRFFHVRDRHTLEYFGDPAVRCGPDLFWWTAFGPHKCDDARLSEDVLLNLRGWRDTNWSPSALLGTIRHFGRRIKGWPLHYGAPEPPQSDRNDVDFMRTHGVASSSTSFQWNDVLASRYVIAMRFHAVQIAVRLERPVIAFDYHPKIRAFFQENELGEMCVPLGDPRALYFAIERLETDFERYREKIMALKSKLLSEGAALRNELLAEIANIETEIAARSPTFSRVQAIRNIVKRLSRS